jgi:hypothetical protein
VLVHHPVEHRDVQLPVAVVRHDFDEHAALPHLVEGDHVAVVLGDRSQDAITVLEGDRVEDHIPGAGRVLDHRHLAPVRPNQGRDLIVDGGDPLGRFVFGLVAADLAFANGVVYNGIDHGPRHQR